MSPNLSQQRVSFGNDNQLCGFLKVRACCHRHGHQVSLPPQTCAHSGQDGTLRDRPRTETKGKKRETGSSPAALLPGTPPAHGLAEVPGPGAAGPGRGKRDRQTRAGIHAHCQVKCGIDSCCDKRAFNPRTTRLPGNGEGIKQENA